MKTFYIFKLNKNYIDIAKKTPNNIFILLSSINNHDKENIIEAFDLFNEICLPINVEFFDDFIFKKLNNYDSYTKFKSVHMYNDYLNDEISKMNINYSHIKIKSNKNDNVFINNLYNLGDLFMCDFNNDFYEYLINREKIISKRI